MTKPDLYTVAEVAALANVDVPTIWKYQSEGRMPKADQRISGRPRWEPETINRWLNNENPDYPRPGKGWARGLGRQDR